jgi:hypothetical protein
MKKVQKEGLDPNKIQLGYMIVDSYSEPCYYGFVIDKTEIEFTVSWEYIPDTYTRVCSYQFSKATGLKDDRIIADERQQLVMKLKLKAKT